MDEVQEAAVVEAALDALGTSATAEQILQAIHGYSEPAIQIALRRLGGGGGAGGAVTLLGPLAVTYQTANIENPVDGFGAVVTSLAAGTLVLAAWPETTTPWAAEVDIQEFAILLKTSTAAILDISNNAGSRLNGAALVLSEDFGAVPIHGVWCHQAQDLCVAIFSSSPMSAGAADVYALVATLP